MSDWSEFPTNVEWLDVINRQEAIALQTATDGDFSVIQLLTAESAANRSVDYRRALLAITGSDYLTTEINDINLALAQASQAAIENYGDAVAGSSSFTADIDWNALIDGEKTQAINYMTVQIKRAAGKAKSLISRLPDDARPTAASLYVIGNNIALQAFSALSSSIGNMNESIPHFMKDNFQVIKDAINAVSAAVDSAINGIRGSQQSVVRPSGELSGE